MGNDQGKGDNKDHRHISLIDDQLQKKFRQGVQFNLKVVIRGERQTGKSCLFQRLQGKSFVEAYEPTNAIQTAHISWSPKHSNDTVKVEIWDVVDRAQVSPSSRKPSMSQKEGSHAVAHLDAMTVNVYQGAQLVVFLYDPFRPETYEYVKQEIHRVPDTLQVLVLSNFRDKPGPFAVTPSSVQSFARSLDGTFVFFECSLLNCYGLSALHQYLSLPYWRMKRAMVERQLKEIDSEMKQTESEFLRLSTNQNYDAFLKGLSLTADTVNGMATDSPRHNTISSPVHDHKLTSNSLRINHDTVRKSVPLPSAFQSASTESISRIDSRPNPHRTSNKELQSIDQFYAGDLDEDFFGESTGDSPVRTRKSVSVDAVPPPPPPPPPPPLSAPRSPSMRQRANGSVQQSITADVSLLVELDVGGRVFKTIKSVLQGTIRNQALLQLLQEGHSCIFIDRAPEYVAPVMNFLRYRRLIVDGNTNLDGVLEEAKFFDIPALVTSLQEQITKQKRKEHEDSLIQSADITRRDLSTALVTHRAREKSKPFVLHGLRMSYMDFSNLDLSNCIFRRCDLKHVNLESTVIRNTLFEDCRMKLVKLSNSQTDGAAFENCDLRHVDFSSLNLSNVLFSTCNMINVNLTGVIWHHGNITTSVSSHPPPSSASSTSTSSGTSARTFQASAGKLPAPPTFHRCNVHGVRLHVDLKNRMQECEGQPIWHTQTPSAANIVNGQV
eukprot:GILJ01003889.1.p1 GENE.GILJ01003889.1~~GILJ01003889.1.p1  ORF type:complete len:722 (-),score=105.96 GILJ01003889.1:126-2291(-)